MIKQRMMLLRFPLLLIALSVATAAAAASSAVLSAETTTTSRTRRRLHAQQIHQDDDGRERVLRRDDANATATPGKKNQPLIGAEEARMDELQVCPTTLDKSIIIDWRATLYYAIVPSTNPPFDSDNGLFCGRLEATNDEDEGWIALGFSPKGRMKDSMAIIGIPNDDTVLKYELYTYGVEEMEDEKQTLRDTSIEIMEDDDGNAKVVMEFTKLLVEEDEVPILVQGMNTFLHARGESSLGYHGDGRVSFSKDFAEDEVEEVVQVEGDESTGNPTEAPTKNPTATPTTNEPSSSPTSITADAGTAERFFCTEDEEPLRDKYCNEGRFPDWYADYDDCDSRCRGKRSCLSIMCVTDRPTVSPTVSASPTATSNPTSSPTKEPSSESPTLSPVVSLALPTMNPSQDVLLTHTDADITATMTIPTEEPKFTFIVPEDKEDPTENIPISPFRLDLVVASVPLDDGDDAGRRRQLEELFFQAAQDSQVRSLVSDHLLSQFENNLDGEPISVELEIDGKSEQDLTGIPGEQVIVSYDFSGYAVYAAAGDGDDSSYSLPTTADLDSQVLKAFKGRGKRAWMNALEYSEDDKLQGIVSVDASSNSIVDGNNELDPSKATENDNDIVGSGSGQDNSSAEALAVPFVALIAAAFAITIVIIGSLTFRKYKKYQENNANNDYHNYQNRKRHKFTIDKNAKKLKQYDHFESPAGSALGHGSYHSEDPICVDDLEIVGGDTYPSSQDPSSPGKQFNPNDESLPYDEEAAGHSVAAYDMTYFAQAANEMMSMDQSQSTHVPVDDETLEGLYSDKDSYFQSTVDAGGSARGHHRTRSESIHSLDTVDNTFGFITGIQEVLERNDDTDTSTPTMTVEGQEDGNDEGVDMESSYTDVTSRVEGEGPEDDLQGECPESNNADALLVEEGQDDLQEGVPAESNNADTLRVEEVQEDELENPSLLLSPDSRAAHIGEVDTTTTSLDANSDEDEDSPVFEDAPPEEIAPKSNDDATTEDAPEDFVPQNDDDTATENKPVPEEMTPKSNDDTTAEDASNLSFHEDSPKEITPKSKDDITNWRLDNNPTPTANDSVHLDNEDSALKKIDAMLEKIDDSAEEDGSDIEFAESSPTDTSQMSTTDELFARIAELESKILNTEATLAQDESIMLVTPSKIGTEEPSTTSPPSNSEGRMVSPNNAPTSSDDASSIQKGVFTQETLGMIEQSRLSGTPPPSVDSHTREMIKEAKTNSLLGRYLGDETDSEEDSLFLSES